MIAGAADTPYPDRLATFEGFWTGHEATSRQLAAIGHVYDRPPLEAIEEGSRCVSCSHFVRRDLSIQALEGSLAHLSESGYRSAFEGFQFHHGSCLRLQVRVPLDPQATLAGLHGGSLVSSLRDKWEQRGRPTVAAVASASESRQTSSLFSLPTELRLQIYSMILPALDDVTEVVPINKYDARVGTRAGIEKTGPRDLTKANILRTCKAIHNEALDILYTNRTYRFANSKTLYLFLRHIGKHGRDLLKSVDVYCGSREDAITFSLLATCPKLRLIVIRLPRPRLMFPRAPLWLIDGVAALLSLRGFEQVRFADCGPDILTHLRESSGGASVVRGELMRLTGEESELRWVDGYLDI